MSLEDGILDPAHEEGGIENAGAAGIPKPDEKKTEVDEFKVTEDGNVAEHKGVKYIRKEALDEERAKNHKLSKVLDDLDPLMPEFEQFIKTKNTRRQITRDTVIAQGSDEKEYLEEVAVAMGFYDEQNTPDLRRAQAHLNITRREAKRVAKEEVEPVARSSRTERAAANRQRASNARFVDGQPIAEQKYIEQALSTIGDEHMENPQVANLAAVVAAGLEYLDHRKNGTLPGRTKAARPGREPMHVEHGAGRFDGDEGEMSALDAAAARARGKTPEQWAKMLKSTNPTTGGRRGSAVLEEGV